DFALKCIKDKKVPVGVTVLVAALLLAIVALAGKGPDPSPGKNPAPRTPRDTFCSFPAKKCPSCPSCPSPGLRGCLENGIGYGEKCFYFVEDKVGWSGARNSCRSLGAHLAPIDSREELGFLSRYGGSSQHWVGLRREGAGPWMWLNGSVFKN
ncbi:CLC2E protein, partial [Centropus unirufus]|nr:CLC2E protein [Centropus unirufus]